MRWRSWLMGSLLLAAACGSRVPDQVAAGNGAALGPSGGQGLTATTDLTGSPSDVTTVDPVTGQPIATGSGGSTGGGGPARGGAGGPTTAAPPAAKGPLTASAPGVTASDIKVGLVYDKGAGATNAALGFGGIGQLNQRNVLEALVADVNARGGILGRRMTPVYGVFDSGGADAGTSIEVLEQRFCTTFTEQRVFAAFYGGGPTFAKCMDKISAIRLADLGVDDTLFAQSPYLVVLQINFDRAIRVVVDRLQAAGYYQKQRGGAPGYKLGLVRYDEPQYEGAVRAMRAQLAKHGLEIADGDEVAVRRSQSNDQIVDETNALRAAALKFKSDNVTHVQFLGSGSAYMELIFMQSAEKQLYRPRYGLASWDGGQALSTLLGADANSQLLESLQIGWFPIFDVEAASYSGATASKAFQRCIKLLQDAGETFGAGDATRNKDAIAAANCDAFSYFVAAASAAGTSLTPATFMAGVSRIDGLESAATYLLSTKVRRDAYGGAREASWVTACNCFRYTTPTVFRT